MIVGDFDAVGGAIAPFKANPPLVVDPNAVLPLAVSAQAFQTVAGQRRQNSQIVGCIEHVELPKRRTFDGAELPARLAMKEPLRLLGPKGLDHRYTV